MRTAINSRTVTMLCNGSDLSIRREWIGNRWEVVVEVNGQERSRSGHDTVKEAITAMAERARQWVEEQA